MMKLENWQPVRNSKPVVSQRIIADVYGDFDHPEGATIVTAEVISVVGNIARTRDGKEYELGVMDPQYMEAR